MRSTDIGDFRIKKGHDTSCKLQFKKEKNRFQEYMCFAQSHSRQNLGSNQVFSQRPVFVSDIDKEWNLDQICSLDFNLGFQ
jgi:hypothetical protein